jgi:hypothetical protein
VHHTPFFPFAAKVSVTELGDTKVSTYTIVQ